MTNVERLMQGAFANQRYDIILLVAKDPRLRIPATMLTSAVLRRLLPRLVRRGGGNGMQSDEDYIRRLMPAWVPFERVVSIVCGLWLMGWGAFILLMLMNSSSQRCLT